MKSFNLLDRLLGRKPEIAKDYAAELRGEAVKTPVHPEAERIAASIRDYPEDWAWTMKGYKLGHVPSDFVLWVANKDYGLGEDHGSYRTNFSEPEQAIIWPAVEAWMARHKVGFTGRPVRPRLHRKDGAFWCQSSNHPWLGVGHTAEDAYHAWSAGVSAQARGELGGGRYLVVQRWPE